MSKLMLKITLFQTDFSLLIFAKINQVHPMNIPFIQKRFEETPETLVLFDKLSALAQKAIKTTNPVICQQSIK